jgi:hypothetical protein
MKKLFMLIFLLAVSCTNPKIIPSDVYNDILIVMQDAVDSTILYRVKPGTDLRILKIREDKIFLTDEINVFVIEMEKFKFLKEQGFIKHASQK